MDIINLKARAYDIIATIESLKAELMKVNQDIIAHNQKANETKTEPPKE